MVFVAVCHTLDNDHVKSNFILFAMSIKAMVISWGKTSYYYFDWTPTFAVLAKKHYFFFVFRSINLRIFKIVLMVFVLFCHQLDGVCVVLHHDNIHVKGNFILFAMTIESW